MIYALTIFVVGVENVMVASWSQYNSITLDALQTSSVALGPQLYDKLLDMLDETNFDTAVLEQTHCCKSFSPSPHNVEYVAAPTPFETAVAAHGAYRVSIAFIAKDSRRIQEACRLKDRSRKPRPPRARERLAGSQ